MNASSRNKRRIREQSWRKSLLALITSALRKAIIVREILKTGTHSGRSCRRRPDLLDVAFHLTKIRLLILGKVVEVSLQSLLWHNERLVGIRHGAQIRTELVHVGGCGWSCGGLISPEWPLGETVRSSNNQEHNSKQKSQEFFWHFLLISLTDYENPM